MARRCGRRDIAALAMILSVGTPSTATSAGKDGRAPGQPQLRALVGSLDEALVGKEQQRAQEQFTPRVWSRPVDSGHSLFERFSRAGSRLRLRSADGDGRRWVLDVDVLARGKLAEVLQLYVVRVGAGLLIDGIDHGQADTRLFRMCLVPGDSSTVVIEGGPDLVAMGDKLLRASIDRSTIVDLERDGPIRRLSELLDELARIQARRVVSALSLRITSGSCLPEAITFEGATPDAGAPLRLTAVLTSCGGVDAILQGDLGRDWLVEMARGQAESRRDAFVNHCGPCFRSSFFGSFFFRPETTAFDEGGEAVLDALVETMRGDHGSWYQPRVLLLLGYRDRREHGAGLGLRRAETVKRALIARGLLAERLRVVDGGDRRPHCLEPTADCAAHNRTVRIQTSTCLDELSQ